MEQLSPISKYVVVVVGMNSQCSMLGEQIMGLGGGVHVVPLVPSTQISHVPMTVLLIQ